MITEHFEIFGTRIKLSEIRDFRIIQKEYIYRPTYKETKNLFGKSKYEFYSMQPYASIVDQYDRKSSLSKYKPNTFKESFGKDVIEVISTTVGDKFNIKALRSTKYECINQTGRRFSTYLEDIPALIMSQEGKFSDVHKHDDLYKLLGSPIAPAINIVPALLIIAKEQFIFYGCGIQLENIEIEYKRLKIAVSEYEQSKSIEAVKQASIGSKFFPSLPLRKGEKNKAKTNQITDNDAN